MWRTLQFGIRNITSNKKLLITGGAGYIGSTVIRHIIDNTNHSVVNVDKLTTSQYPTPAVRLKNTSMSKDKIVKTFDVDICNWRLSLYSEFNALIATNVVV